MMFENKLKKLHVSVAGQGAGMLARESHYTFAYTRADPGQLPVSLLMPASKLVYSDGDLFPSMDMNLPEGYLFQRILELSPKAPPTKMHLLALAGGRAIGRVGFVIEFEDLAQAPIKPTSKQEILASTNSDDLFEQLLRYYLPTGAGISGVQPKVMVPSRATLPTPDLIVKADGAAYPGLSANEFLCMTAAKAAGINTAECDLSVDGKILVVDRFDVTNEGRRLGFEDIAALMGRRVHDRLSNRKYEGSYELVAQALNYFQPSDVSVLSSFFEQLAFSVMVRNGDAHLKNFGLLYDKGDDVRLAPMYDVVTTAIYEHERPGGEMVRDLTLALKFNKSKAYPTTDELLEFGKNHCRVDRPHEILERIAEGMSKAISSSDERIPADTKAAMLEFWQVGQEYALEAARKTMSPRKRKPG